MPRASDPNRCRAAETEQFHTPAPAKKKARPPTGASSPPLRGSPAQQNRLHDDKTKLAIFRRYRAWVEAGKPYGRCPDTELAQEYGCSRDYAKRLHDKVQTTGSLSNQWHMQGRPADIGEAVWEQMVTIIREARTKHKVASSRIIAADLRRAAPPGCRVPKQWRVCQQKKAMGFRTLNVIKKPKLNTRLWKERLDWAKGRTKSSAAEFLKSVARRVVLDEKWLSATKAKKVQIEARDTSPLPLNQRFIEVAEETDTQRVKIMFLIAVCAKGPIGLYELNFKEWNKHNVNPRNGKHAKGITGAFMVEPFKQVAKDARKLLGPGPLDVEVDRAPSHRACYHDGTLTKVFCGKAEMLAGKGPDMSMCDAGFCPWLEREIEDSGATTAEQIREAARLAWEKVDKAMCEAVALRIRKNMQQVIKLKGGNFYNG